MTELETNSPECGWKDTTTGEPCQNTVANPEDYCHLHGPEGEIPEDHGAPTGNSGGVAGQSGPPGNDNAVGNPGGSPPEGNMNALRSGIHADPVNLFDWLLEEDRDAAVWILNKLYSYSQDAPKPVYEATFTPDDVNSFEDAQMNLTAYGDDVLLMCIRDYARWRATKQQLQEGIIKDQLKATKEGAVNIEDSNPVNLDLDRMDKTTIRQKDKLGLLPSPANKEAEAKKDLGQLAREALEPQD